MGKRKGEEAPSKKPITKKPKIEVESTELANQNLGNYDIWNEIFKYLKKPDLSNLRIVSKRHYLFLQRTFTKIHKAPLFRMAAHNEDMETLIEMYEDCDGTERRKLIEVAGPMIYTTAAASKSCSQGIYDILDQIHTWAIDNELSYKLIHGENDSIFKIAAAEGNLHLLRVLHKLSAKKDRTKMIQSNGYEGFVNACINGHVEAMHTIFDWSTACSQQKMLSAKSYMVLKNAMTSKDEKMAMEIIDLMTDKTLSEMVTSSGMYKNTILYTCIQTRSLNVLKRLYELSPAEDQRKILTDNKYCLLIDALSKPGYSPFWDFLFVELKKHCSEKEIQEFKSEHRDYSYYQSYRDKFINFNRDLIKLKL